MSARKALPLIRAFEGCKLAAYRCPAGVWTIGWGATGDDVGPRTVWTQERADARLLLDVEHFERGVRALVHVPLSEGQLGALISFAYNCGLRALGGSTLLRLVNARDPAASDQFLRWDKAGGKRLPGLTRRRAAEKAMFDHG